MSVIETPAPARTEVEKREVWHRAADLLEEFGWCKGVPARDASNNPVLPTQSDAVAFCALGALYRASVDLEVSTPMADGLSWDRFPLGEMERAWGLGPDWNDARCRTKEEVVARLRAAADAAQDEGAGT